MTAGGWQGSLRARMLISATLVLIIFLGIMGLVLDNAFRQSAEQSVSERLLIHIYMLIAVTDEDPLADQVSLYLPDELPEPQFNSLGTGLNGVVFDATGQEIWRSASALELQLSDVEKNLLMREAQTGVIDFDRLARADARQEMFYLSYRVLWQGAEGEQSEFAYVVLQDLGPFRNEVSSFRNNLWTWLVAGIVVLVAVQAAIMSWGLSPIGALERDLGAIEEGERDYLEGEYPREIAGVTKNLNLLLEGERRQRERYRTTLADLAHSLKTPLAILKAQAAKPDGSVDELTDALDEQIGRMNEIVSYQLERAVVHTHSLVKHDTDVAPVLEKLVKALQQVYRHKDLEIGTAIADASFAGDERDLMEMLGNLLDNACKYGDGVVDVSVQQDDSGLMITVEDNGPGIAEDSRELVLQRGTRLDSMEAGQGIGLAVVAEIVDRYQGKIDIESASLGGTRISLQFPAA